VTGFDDFCRRKEEVAAAVPIPGYRTVREDPAATGLKPVGNTWSERLFDGTFYRSVPKGDLPTVSLVFVQSRSGNTVADNPSTLGGGETDKHLIYEGLSRVDADAVLAGATTARSERMVFSVWHPEMIRLRETLGRPRHPAQVIVTDRAADLPLDSGILFNEPSLRVIVITKTSTAALLRPRLGQRPWVEIVDAGEPVSLTRALRDLHARGIRVISAIGGRRTAGALLEEGLVDDIYLTTSAIDAGEPNTPFYTGAPPRTVTLLEKAGQGSEAGVTFEHLLIR
jgi:5-amino-6-(5-phosphoribosylamino)uracil reductase